MKINILAFGIARDIVGGSELPFTVEEQVTVGELKAALLQQFPQFENLRSLAIAVNSEYAQDDQRLTASDEVVLIPPVSGG
ncbi:MAG: MoaD/ThiS family protein [Bacteroidota bacterium]